MQPPVEIEVPLRQLATADSYLEIAQQIWVRTMQREDLFSAPSERFVA